MSGSLLESPTTPLEGHHQTGAHVGLDQIILNPIVCQLGIRVPAVGKQSTSVCVAVSRWAAAWRSLQIRGRKSPYYLRETRYKKRHKSNSDVHGRRFSTRRKKPLMSDRTHEVKGTDSDACDECSLSVHK